MIPIDQTIVDAGRGDCVRACVASILEVPITAVPNFSDAPEGLFHSVYRATLHGYGWIVCDAAHPKGVALWYGRGIDGHFVASVPSRNIEGGTHAVIINEDGLVVHDPSPHKNYQDENVFETEQVHYFDTYQPRVDDDWGCYHAMAVRAKMRKNDKDSKDGV